MPNQIPPFLQYKGRSLLTYQGQSTAAAFYMAALGYVLIYIAVLGAGVLGIFRTMKVTLQCRNVSVAPKNHAKPNSSIPAV